MLKLFFWDAINPCFLHPIILLFSPISLIDKFLSFSYLNSIFDHVFKVLTVYLINELILISATVINLFPLLGRMQSRFNSQVYLVIVGIL